MLRYRSLGDGALVHLQMMHGMAIGTCFAWPTCDAANPLFKKDIQEFDIAPGGSLPSISCSLSTSIAADAFALVKLGTIAQGKTITWAWMSRGFLSRSTAATWHFNGDEIMLEEHMKKVNGLYRNLLNMKKLPTLDNRASTQLVSVFP